MKSRRTPRDKRRRTNIRIRKRDDRQRQRHVLDVKIRSTKESRLRLAAQTRFAFKAAALLLLLIGVVAGAKSLFNRALYHGDHVVVETLEVRTSGSLTKARILEEAGVKEGANLLRLDLPAIRERLEQLPQVATADVVRVLPDTLAITLAERLAVAWLSCPEAGVRAYTSQGGFLVDSNGVAFRCDALLSEYMRLPVIHVAELIRIRDGFALESAQVNAAVAVLQVGKENLPAGGWNVREIEVGRGFTVLARYDNEAEVTYAVDELDRQFRDLTVVIEHARGLDREIATLNLAMRRNIPVTYFGESGVAGEIHHLNAAGDRAVEPDRAGGRQNRQVQGILGGA